MQGSNQRSADRSRQLPCPGNVRYAISTVALCLLRQEKQRIVSLGFGGPSIHRYTSCFQIISPIAMRGSQELAATAGLTKRSTTMKNSNRVTDPLLPTSASSTSLSREAEPLLHRGDVATSAGTAVNNPWANFVNGLYNGASNLANLLPTGTFLAFTAIGPIVTDNGTCDDPFEYNLTLVTTIFFALFCFLTCFTDSYQAADGEVYYGIVTFKGLWTPQLPVILHPGDKEEYKVTVIDVIHAVLSVAVFVACSLMTPNIRGCLYANLKDNIVRIVPAFVGFFVSAVFIALPSKRHGIGFPVSPSSFSFTSREAKYLQKREAQLDAASLKGPAATEATSSRVGPKKQ
ncbi:hypothetical protein R1sor_013733 [Riccia sorocarpa]|uniref:Uncharacterized protein n=1 Tax=Riccia sorocarpa TaxID=122646 RepID=A0ABD3HDM3_9MARC